MVLGDVIVGHNGDVRALQKRLDEIAGARQQTGSDFDVITARVKRDRTVCCVWSVVFWFIVCALRESDGVCLAV